MPEMPARRVRSWKTRGLMLVTLGCVLWPAIVPADPVGDFFKKVGRSLSHPNQKPATARPRESRTKPASIGNRKEATNPSPSPAGQLEVVATATPSPTPAPNVARVATINPDAHGSSRDVPYAIPVPNKPGFVTSPYAPNQGLVDVRGFRSGTEVKDPYTGKFFLIP